MKVHECCQGSVEWMELRCAIPTASEFSNLITPKGKIRTGDMVKSYLSRKLAERWGGPLPGFGSFATEYGHILEGEALPWLDFEFGWKIERVGFVTTDDGAVGCSPDGLIGDDSGVEVKCPEAPQHVRYLLAGEVPEDYVAQVQGELYVTGRPHWKFVSYRRHYPPLIIDMEPLEEFQENLAEALGLFCSTLENSWKYLLELNGGPPPKREAMVFSNQFVPNMEDVLQ